MIIAKSNDTISNKKEKIQMDKIIMGLLMLNRLTIYQIHKIIKQNFSSMCSDSLGSIQVTIRKLLQNECITCTEYMEKSVNKKLYSITNSGRDSFMQWVKQPINMDKAKNMELSKLLFMGFVPKNERIALLDEIILALTNDLAVLEKIDKSEKNLNNGINQLVSYLEQDAEYSKALQTVTGNTDNFKNASEIGAFQMLSLQFGIDTTQFQLAWFKSLKEKIDNEYE